MITADSARNTTAVEIAGSNNPIGVSLYSGAMGLDLGLERGARVRFLVAADAFAAARATVRINRPGLCVFDDAERVTAAQVRRAAGLAQHDIIDIVAGCPPCPPWSVAGRRRGVDDPRGMLLPAFVDLAIALGPRLILHENVKGLVSAELGGERSGLLRMLVAELRRNGYRVAYEVLNAANYGTPQSRERLILIACRDSDPCLPESTHSRHGQGGLPRWLTLREAVAALPAQPCDYLPYPPSRLKYFAMLEAGQSWRDLPLWAQKEALGNAKRTEGGSSFCRRLAWDEPCPTVLCEPHGKNIGFCHPDFDRPLSVQEYRRIQGFPDDWLIRGSIQDRYTQIGNAVPIPLAEAVGRAVAKSLGGGGGASQPRPRPVEIATGRIEIKQRLRAGRRLLSNGTSKRGPDVFTWACDLCPFKTGPCSRQCYARRGKMPLHAARYTENREIAQRPGFEDSVRREIEGIAARRGGRGFAVGLHLAGDFFSIEYLDTWRRIMLATAGLDGLRYYATTRSWVDPAFRAALERIAAECPHARVNISVDRENCERAELRRIGDGRILYLTEHDGDLPPVEVDIVQRDVGRVKEAMELLGGLLVCPNESGLHVSLGDDGRPVLDQRGRAIRIRCQECRLCIDRGVQDWLRIGDRYRGVPGEPPRDALFD